MKYITAATEAFLPENYALVKIEISFELKMVAFVLYIKQRLIIISSVICVCVCVCVSMCLCVCV